MAKKNKNKAAKAKQSANSAAKSNKPNGVDIPKSNPDNYITIELPDNPNDKPSSVAPSTSKTEGKSKAAKPAEKSHNAKTDEKPSENDTSTPPVADNADTGKDNSQDKGTADNSSKSASLGSAMKTVVGTLQKKAESIKANKGEKPEKEPLTQEQLDSKKKRRGIVLSRTADVVTAFILIIVALLILLPIFFAVVQSAKPLSELRDAPQSFFPKSFSMQTFGELFSANGDSGISSFRFLFNTLIITIVVTTLRIVITTGAAYILAKVRAPMLKTINGIINVSLALTPALAYTMNYVILVKTGLADTIFALILPYIASPLCLVLLRESIKRIPDETILAARLEGCSHTAILRRIVLPQIKPAITAVTILTLFEMGKITGGAVTFSEKLDTLSAFMETLYNRAAFGELYALAVLMLIPVVVLLIVFRRSILETMTTAMLKEEK